MFTDLRISTLSIALVGLLGLGLTTTANAESPDPQSSATVEHDVAEDDDQVCVDASLADELAPEAEFGPWALLCELECQREYNCGGQGDWCWDALAACKAACHD